MIFIYRAEKECALILQSISGYEVPPYYDSMIAKIIVHARNRSGGRGENAECA